MVKTISKAFAIKKEVELKSEYLDSYLDMAIAKIKIYTVCRDLLKNIRGFKTANRYKIDDYLSEREEELLKHKYLSTSRTLMKIFLEANRKDLSDNIMEEDIYELFKHTPTDKITEEFIDLTEADKTIIDQLLILSLEVSRMQTDAVSEVAELFNFIIDADLLDTYNIESGAKRHITRRILEDLPFYIAYQILYSEDKSVSAVEEAIKNSYKDITEWEYDMAKIIIDSFKIVTTVKTERFDKFLELIGGNRNERKTNKRNGK